MNVQDFIFNTGFKSLPEQGEVAFRAPSNIALVKYWGKSGEQLPKNSSISFTLSRSFTETTLHYVKQHTNHCSFEVYFNGKRKRSFEPKIQQFFERVEPYFSEIKKYHFKIETSNSFPHSSGIASSASGMAALAMCLTDMEKQLSINKFSDDYYTTKASFLARLGSGSACRSVEGPLVIWGKHPDIEKSSDLYGIRYPYEVHPVFKDYCDTILLVDEGKKQVSSTAGHELMHRHPFAASRFEQAFENLKRLIRVLREGDLETFMEIVETEALSLHAMMLTSNPSYILMQPHTLEIIQRIRRFRHKESCGVCFTLDAGANVHVLFPAGEKEKVNDFIKNELAVFCQNGKYISDQTGYGAERI